MKLKESLEMIPTDEMELYSYLSKATEEDILKIRPLISTMYAEGNLIIKQTLMELIGDDEFHEYIDLVKEEIKAPTSMDISATAFVTLYDLLGSESFTYIQQNRKLQNSKEILVYRCLKFIEEGAADSLNILRSILVSPQCDYRLQYIALHLFDRYLEIPMYDELVGLFKEIMAMTDPQSGIYRDLQRVIG